MEAASALAARHVGGPWRLVDLLRSRLGSRPWQRHGSAERSQLASSYRLSRRGRHGAPGSASMGVDGGLAASAPRGRLEHSMVAYGAIEGQGRVCKPCMPSARLPRPTMPMLAHPRPFSCAKTSVPGDKRAGSSILGCRVALRCDGCIEVVAGIRAHGPCLRASHGCYGAPHRSCAQAHRCGVG